MKQGIVLLILAILSLFFQSCNTTEPPPPPPDGEKPTIELTLEEASCIQMSTKLSSAHSPFLSTLKLNQNLGVN